VSCELTDSLLHGYFDGELHPLRAAEFERHLAHCTECATGLVDLDLLSARLQLARLYGGAPASLQRKVRANLRSGPLTPAAAKPLLWHWLAAAAALLLFAIAGWRLNRYLPNDDYQAELAQEIVAAHMNSLHPGNLTGLASNDERVVQAWLQGKARFALPVHDFSQQGFQLLGARMDLVEDRTIAALVYARGNHLVNVFIWPTRERDRASREGSRQGFQWVDWQKGKIEFCAVSDADPGDLERLQGLILESLNSNTLIPGQSRTM
jgi:anti-sigma factor RsiW